VIIDQLQPFDGFPLGFFDSFHFARDGEVTDAIFEQRREDFEEKGLGGKSAEF